jgi:hypothetical protein
MVIKTLFEAYRHDTPSTFALAYAVIRGSGQSAHLQVD